MVDKSLSFGMQNFFWVEENTADGTYDYNSFQNKKGTILILRTNKAGTSGLYWAGSGVYATIWAAKGDYTYVLPAALK